MADKVLGSASVEVFADLSRLRSGLSEARRQTDRTASAMASSATTARTAFERAGTGLGRSVRQARTEAEALNRELRKTDTSLASLFTGIGAGAAITGVVRLADEFTRLRGQISLVVGAGEDASAVFERIFATAQQTGASVSALTVLYTRLRQSIAGLGDAEALSIARAFSESLAISGAGAQETESFLRQISQALASGVLRGDEFNSVMESNARFARLLADDLGVGVGQLRSMAEQGQLTADVIRGAIARSGGDLSAEFESLPLTIERAGQQLQNAIIRYIGEADSGLGASQRLAQGIQAVADNFDKLADAIVILGAAGLGNILGRGIVAGADRAVSATRLMALAIGVEEARILEERDRAIERLQRQDDVLDQHARQRVFLQEQLTAAKKALVEQDAILERRLTQNSTPQGQERGPVTFNRAGPFTGAGEDISKNPADFTQFNNAQRVAVENYRREVERLKKEIFDLEQAQIREAKAGLESERVRRIAAGAVEDVNTKLQVHNSLLSRAQRVGVTAASAIAGGFTSLVNVLGGPIPALLTAISVALIFYRSQADLARTASNSLADALQLLIRSGPATASASQDAAQGHDKAAQAAERRAKQERALAEAQKAQAVATIEQAIADQKRLISSAQFNRDFNILNLGEILTNGNQNRFDQTIRKAQESIRILEEGLAAVQSGKLDVTAPAAPATPRTPGTPRGAQGVNSELETIRAYAAKAQAQVAALKQQALDADRKAADAAQAESERRAERARQIVEDQTSELEKARKEIEEIQSLAAQGLFGANPAAALGAITDSLSAMAYAAGDAAEALAILKRYSGDLSPKALDEASKRLEDAARQGRGDRRQRAEQDRIFRTEDFARSASDGLYQAVTTGQWRDALRSALYNAFDTALRRATERLVDSVIDIFSKTTSGTGKSGGGILGTILGGIVSGVGSVIGGVFKSATPSTNTLSGAGITSASLGANLSGVSSAALAATKSFGAGVTKAASVINIDLRNSNIEDVAAAEARLQAAAQKGAIMGAEIVQRQLRASTTV